MRVRVVVEYDVDEALARFTWPNEMTLRQKLSEVHGAVGPVVFGQHAIEVKLVRSATSVTAV